MNGTMQQTTTDSAAATRAPAPDARLRDRRIVLATDESTLAHAAARVVAALARDRGARPAVVRVVDPVAEPPLVPLTGMVPTPMAWGAAPDEADIAAMRARLRAEVAESREWPFHARLGSPAERIVAFADEEQAALIVVGLRTHGPVDRLFHDETALHVCRLAHCSVLAVTARARALPRHIVVATDFAPSAARLLRMTLAVAAPDAHVTILHVRQPSGTWWDNDAGTRVVRRLGIAAAFDELLRDPAAAAAAAGGMRFATQVVDGAPAEQLVRYGHAHDVDLLAISGTWPAGAAAVPAGTVAKELARDGAVSLLVGRAPGD